MSGLSAGPAGAGRGDGRMSVRHRRPVKPGLAWRPARAGHPARGIGVKMDDSRSQSFVLVSVPEGYERFMLCQLFEPWAAELLSRAGLQPAGLVGAGRGERPGPGSPAGRDGGGCRPAGGGQ